MDARNPSNQFSQPNPTGYQNTNPQMPYGRQIPYYMQAGDIWQPIQEIIRNGQALRQEMMITDQNVRHGNQMVGLQMMSLENEVRNLGRKKRKSCTNQFVSVQEEGEILLVSQFDDGTMETQQFMINVIGNWKICRLEFYKTWQADEWFLIRFESAKINIFGRFQKLNARGLYDMFLRAGVVFNANISLSKVENALYSCFAPLLVKCEAVAKFPELAGWYDGRFLYAQKTGFTNRQDFPKLPIQQKYFDDGEKLADSCKDYFAALRHIQGVRERLVFLLYPFAGLLASIFSEEDFRIPVFLNLVMMEEVDMGLIISYFQIFNRDERCAWSLSESKKRTEDLLKTLNDEVAIFNVVLGQEGKYEKRKMKQNAQMTVNKALGKAGMHQGEGSGPYVALMLLSDSVICNQNALNLFVSKDLFADAEQCRILMKGKVLSGILAGFVTYAEKNLEIIRGQIRKKRESMEPAIRFWNVMFEIAEMFWQEQGVDLKAEAKLPYKINISQLFEKDVFSNEERLQVFLEVVRKEIHHFSAFDKRFPKQDNPYNICYDTEYIYFPSPVFDKMLGMNGLMPQKNEILLQMKMEGIMKVDEMGLTRRMQIAGERREYYQIHRNFFNQPGLPEIIDLSREDMQYADGYGRK